MRGVTGVGKKVREFRVRRAARTEDPIDTGVREIARDCFDASNGTQPKSRRERVEMLAEQAVREQLATAIADGSAYDTAT